MSVDALSATDRAFLDAEGGNLALHVGAVLVFEGGGFVGADGGLDARRLTALIGAAVAELPRCRQRVEQVPGLGAGWIDDPHFRLDHHVCLAAVPRPGDAGRLFELAGRVFARPLDRRRPLWELWLVEGLGAGRFALIVKAHHAMVDGVAGIGLLARLLSLGPGEGPPPAGATPAPHVTGRLEVAYELARGRALGLRAAAGELSHALGQGAEPRAAVLGTARDAARGLLETLRDGLLPADATRLNPPALGPHRAYHGVRLELERTRQVKHALGGTVNDVILAIVAGGLRRYFLRHGDAPDALTDFRALVPVNLRTRQGLDGAAEGNHVSLVLAHLPVHLADARARYQAVLAVTEHLKHESHEIDGAAWLERVSDLGGPNVISAAFSLAMRLRAFNVVVTNVPGPPVPLYLGPAALAELWALVPLFEHQGLGIAVASYQGGLTLGLHADPDAVADLEAIAADLAAELDVLTTLALDAPG